MEIKSRSRGSVRKARGFPERERSLLTRKGQAPALSQTYLVRLIGSVNPRRYSALVQLIHVVFRHYRPMPAG